jgi:hypothetical protein
MTERTGGCLCGAVRFTARDVNPRFSVCHCKMCQRVSGGPLFAVSAPAAGFALEGAEHVRRIASSDIAERTWCGKCGSTLWYRVTAEGDAADYELALGLFDDTAGFEIKHEIFIDTKPAAYALSGDHTRLTEAEYRATRAGTPEGDA